MQKIRKKVAFQKKNQAFNGKEALSEIMFPAELEEAFHSSRIHKGAAVWLILGIMNSSILDAIKARLALSSNDANNDEGIITTNAIAMNHLLRRHTTDAVIAKSHKNF